MTRRNPGSTWLVVLRADALEDWLKANHTGIQRKGPKGYKSLCNSDTSLIAYLRWCTHGVEIGAVDRAFVVSAATGSEAAMKGLKEFNAATVRMYQPLLSMAIERVLPGPVYMAEIYDRETSAVEYEPFTPASKDEMLREVQERASEYGEGFDLKVAAFSRAPATLGRRFIEGTAENIDFSRNRVDMSEAAADDARDQMDEVSGMVAGSGFSVGLPQPMWSPAMMKAYAKGDENAFDQAYLEFKSRARTEEHADQVRKSMLPELSKADMQRKLTGNPYKVVIPSVRGISFARRNPSSSSELYHATLSGKNDEIVLSMIDGIDSSRAQGFGQGQGFYLFTHRKEAVNHARGLVSGRGFAKEVKVEGEPIIVVVDAPLTPENYDADYEVSAADFRRFLFVHKDWIRDNADKLGLVFWPAYTSTSRFSPAVISVPDGITLTAPGMSRATFSIMAEPPADDPAKTGLAARLSILAQRIAAVSPELLLQFEESTLKTMPAVKYVGPKIQPARIERPDGTVIWRRDVRSNPKDLEGRYIPDRYLAGLPAALQKQRIGELTQSRDDYKRGDYSELPTDRTARKMGLVKQSNYTTTAKERGVEWRGNAEDMAKRVLMVYSGRAPANEVQQFAEALRKSFSKGLAAWKSGGHRPGASQQNWAVARVNSLVVGGKTSWTADKKLFEVLPAAVRAKIEAMRAKQNPLRRNPVEDKQEQQEVWKLLGLGKGKQRKLERQAVKKLEELKTDPKLAEDLVSDALLYAATYIFRLADYSDIVADLDRWSSEFWRAAERYVETNAHLAAEHSHASPPARRRAEQIKQQAASLTRLTGTKPTLAELSKSLQPIRGVGMTPDQIRTAVAAGRPPILLAIDTLSHKDRKHLQLPEVGATYQTDAEQLQEQKNLAAFAQAQLSETEKKVLERSLADSPNWAQLGLTVSEGKYRAAAAVMKLRNTVRALQAHNIAQAHVLELSDVAKVYADSSPRRIILTSDGEEMDVQDLRDALIRAEDRAAKAEVRLLTTSGNTNILEQWEAERRRLEAREAVLIEAIPEGTRGRW